MKPLSLIFILAIVITSLIRAYDAKAQSASDFAISISPTILEIHTDTPATINAPIKLKNTSDSTQKLSVAFRTIKGNYNASGVVELKNEKALVEPDVYIRSKITVLEGESAVSEVDLAPDQEKIMVLRINLEEEAPHGDYYFSLLFVSNNNIGPSDRSGAKAIAGIGTNVLLSIGQQGPTSGHITAFSSPTFLTKGPVPFTLQLENTSDHFIKPTGNIKVVDMFGNNLATIDIVPEYILSHSSRYLNREKLTWNQTVLFGMYTAEVNIRLSDKGPEFKDKITFFAISLNFIVGLTLFTFILAGIYLRVKRKLSVSEQKTKKS